MGFLCNKGKLTKTETLRIKMEIDGGESVR